MLALAAYSGVHALVSLEENRQMRRHLSIFFKDL